MKKIIYGSLFGGLVILLVTSCKKATLTHYNAADNIYFNFISDTDPVRYADTTNVTFAFSNSSVTDTVFHLPVAVTGLAGTTDRTFGLTVDGSSTAVAGTDYVLPSSLLIHAGHIVDTIPIQFKRTAAIRTKAVVLFLRLRANDQFKTQLTFRSRSSSDQLLYIAPGDTIAMQTFKMILSDMLQAGPYWTNYSYYFGDFSEKKVRLMNQVSGMPLDFWSVDLYSTQQQQSNALYYGGLMYRYLSDQAFGGNTIFEADGVTPMTMGSYFLY
jgi:hypothetical protein